MDSRYSIENSFSTTAPGIGTGVGVNTLIGRFDGERNSEAAEGTARTGSFLGLINWIAFTVLIIPALCLYLRYSSDDFRDVRISPLGCSRRSRRNGIGTVCGRSRDR